MLALYLLTACEELSWSSTPSFRCSDPLGGAKKAFSETSSFAATALSHTLTLTAGAGRAAATCLIRG